MGTLPGAADFGTGGGAGNTFPGATVPFGMVAVQPRHAARRDELRRRLQLRRPRLQGLLADPLQRRRLR